MPDNLPDSSKQGVQNNGSWRLSAEKTARDIDCPFFMP